MNIKHLTTAQALASLNKGNLAHLIRYKWKERGRTRHAHTVWLAPTKRQAITQFQDKHPHVTVIR
jgi:hypothetical protein